MLSGVAELLSIDPELLDDLKTAVSEACNNVVLHAYDGEPGPMDVALSARGERIVVTVDDRGVGLPPVGEVAELPQGIGLSVIRALAVETALERRPEGGTIVRMEFAGRRDGRSLFAAPPTPAPDRELEPVTGGDVVISLSPVSLLAGVLGRLARTLAATAHFSLDRFSDVYLVTDTLAVHAATAAAADRVGAHLSAGDRRLEVEVGPFRRGTGARLGVGVSGRPPTPLVLLSDEVTVVPEEGAERLRVVVVDHRR